jgi:hypothetical protein
MTVTERPILFSAPMVRAILAGQKTQTRRIACKGLIPAQYVTAKEYEPGRWRLFDAEDARASLAQYTMPPCPYGQPGDRLWVREAFSGDHSQEANPPALWNRTTPFWYWADGNPTHGDWTKPRPSIHMPRWASRITLEITGVRAERLESCSKPDAIAEGIGPRATGWRLYDDVHGYTTDPRYSYRTLWESINGAESWDANPWVWVVEFKRA